MMSIALFPMLKWLFGSLEKKSAVVTLESIINTVRARKLTYYGHTMRKQGSYLPGDRDNARNNARCTQTRKTTHGLDGHHQDMDTGQDSPWKSQSK